MRLERLDLYWSIRSQYFPKTCQSELEDSAFVPHLCSQYLLRIQTLGESQSSAPGRYLVTILRMWQSILLPCCQPPSALLGISQGSQLLSSFIDTSYLQTIWHHHTISTCHNWKKNCSIKLYEYRASFVLEVTTSDLLVFCTFPMVTFLTLW